MYDDFGGEPEPGVLPDALLAACYADLRRVARRIMANDAAARVFQPTELANEAAIRLLKSNLAGVANRGHMLALAARTMRQVLIDEARRNMAGKRQQLQIMTVLPNEFDHRPIDIEALDRALAALSRFSLPHAEVVELRYMMGLSLVETAAATGVSERTVKRRWQAARLWLLDHLSSTAAA